MIGSVILRNMLSNDCLHMYTLSSIIYDSVSVWIVVIRTRFKVDGHSVNPTLDVMIESVILTRNIELRAHAIFDHAMSPSTGFYGQMQ